MVYLGPIGISDMAKSSRRVRRPFTAAMMRRRIQARAEEIRATTYHDSAFVAALVRVAVIAVAFTDAQFIIKRWPDSKIRMSYAKELAELQHAVHDLSLT